MKIEFEAPDNSVYTKDRKFEDLNFDEKMYIAYLLFNDECIERRYHKGENWVDSDISAFYPRWSYRPKPKDDEVDWAALPYDWVVRYKNGQMFNCEKGPYIFKELETWEDRGQAIRIDQLLTTKGNGKHWTESKMERPEEFKHE